ncbi:MarR family winged helix-turn-helix transcriptional regulator [Lacticaseibacillus brantae]|uniref:HTH marR-type domain-containing protein n=1 Tax=Lacticaseibacillus brantae DSM 23927 TaxID=1423727 RepID=A0A0R2AY96_9LACO|nr:MarR family transcriptional regulator [Lacticaseibacillus brantae]KRM72039.1 hypothetical protein FC34_GL001022 [Lacticaseibacillus brantae DSM 23927]
MTVTNEDLFSKLRQFQWLLNRRQFQTTAEDGPLADPTRGQGRVIATLKLQEEISTKSLAFLLRISVPSANELLNKLEKGGYITRTPSTTDGRIMISRLTTKGKQVEQNRLDPSAIFDIFSPEEHVDFAHYLDRLTEALEADFKQSGLSPEQFDWRTRPARPMSAEELDRFIDSHPNGPFDPRTK